MKLSPWFLVALLSAFPVLRSFQAQEKAAKPPAAKGALQLGNFSVSLTVKDLAKSRAFYEALGFEVVGGEAKQNWLILQNADVKIGLFQGMFERNMLTFNPGWNSAKETLAEFTDVRELQATLEARGLTPTTRADPDSTGPAFFTLADPDGNPILFDQFVDAPGTEER
jgi:catechol 2,3-dioxygenase-like lactoylglutathione lyase family enzyme